MRRENRPSTPYSDAVEGSAKLWRPELSYLTAEDYLRRRDLFVALSEFAILERPPLGPVTTALDGGDAHDTLPVRALWTGEGEDRAGDEGAVVERQDARKAVIGDVRVHFDKGRKWMSSSAWRNERCALATYLNARRAVLGLAPVADCCFLDPMYRDEEGRPCRRADLLERFAAELDAAGVARRRARWTERWALGEGPQAEPERATETEEGLKLRAELIERRLDGFALYWPDAPTDDIPAWRRLAEAVDAAKPGRVLPVRDARRRDPEWDALLLNLPGWDVPAAARRWRMWALGVVWEADGSEGRWVKPGLHLSGDWRSRLAVLEQISLKELGSE